MCILVLSFAEARISYIGDSDWLFVELLLSANGLTSMII